MKQADLPTDSAFLKKDDTDHRKWFEVCTRPRSEKKVLADLTHQGIETYVPLQKVLHQWKDRKKMVEVPLINSYVFVKLDPLRRDGVFQSVHVIRFVMFNGKPAVVPEKQMEALKCLVEAKVPLEATIEHFKPGDAVKVIFGPMTGIVGEFIEIGREKHFLLRISNIGYSLTAKIPAAWVEKV